MIKESLCVDRACEYGPGSFTMRSSRFRVTTVLLFAALAASNREGFAQQPILKDSPFLPPASAARPDSPAAVDLEFTGVLLAGPQTQVCITRKQARRSDWIRVGETSNGIEIVSHDAATETVVVRADGVTHELKLKSPAPLAAAAPAPTLRPVVAPIAPPTAAKPATPAIEPPPPATTAEKEREARMLVSDLLEIGMQQRKAYEEAQRKAAAEAAKKSAASKPPPSPSPR